MSRRRLLLVCYFFPPLAGGGVHRVLGFARHLPHFGWECTVVCAGEEDYWVRDETLVAAVPQGTEVIRVRGGSAIASWLRLGRSAGRGSGRRAGPLASGLRRLSDWWLLPDSYVGWSHRARRAVARRLARGDVDAVLTSSPPDSVHLAAPGPVRRAQVPWLADFRDPWVGLHFRTPPTSWHRARQARLERRVVEGADAVVAASRLHAERLRAGSAGRVKRVVHLPNGFEPEPAEPDAGPASDASFFTLVFTGTLSLMPETEVLMEALHDLLARRPEARRRLRVRLAGPYDTSYEDRAVALGLRGIVEFTGPLPHAEARALQRRADLLLLWRPRGEGYRTMVPGKLYEYLDAGRPVLALLDEGDEAADLVRRGGGALVLPGRREPLAAAIEARYLDWKDGVRIPRVRPTWLEEHTRSRLAATLAAELDQMRRRPS